MFIWLFVDGIWLDITVSTQSWLKLLKLKPAKILHHTVTFFVTQVRMLTLRFGGVFDLRVQWSRGRRGGLLFPSLNVSEVLVKRPMPIYGHRAASRNRSFFIVTYPRAPVVITSRSIWRNRNWLKLATREYLFHRFSGKFLPTFRENFDFCVV